MIKQKLFLEKNYKRHFLGHTFIFINFFSSNDENNPGVIGRKFCFNQTLKLKKKFVNKSFKKVKLEPHYIPFDKELKIV